jgi:class 3 adenylate cyclase
MYGNIGSDTRLDFTVIGPAVNLTARIESMYRQLGRQLLLSSDFVRRAELRRSPSAPFRSKASVPIRRSLHRSSNSVAPNYWRSGRGCCAA